MHYGYISQSNEKAMAVIPYTVKPQSNVMLIEPDELEPQEVLDPPVEPPPEASFSPLSS